MSDMPIHKVKVKAATEDEARKLAKDQARKDGCEIAAVDVCSPLPEGEWEVEVIVTELPKSPRKKPAPKKAAPKKAAPKKAAASDEPEEKSGWFGKKKSE